MRIYTPANDESKYALLKCEHCGRMDEYDEKKPVEDVVCTKCGMTQDRD